MNKHMLFERVDVVLILAKCMVPFSIFLQPAVVCSSVCILMDEFERVNHPILQVPCPSKTMNTI